MRILMLCTDFGIPVYGHKGASVHLRSMARAFAALGHEVCVVAPEAEPTANTDFDIPVRSLPPTPEQRASVEALRAVDRNLAAWETGHAPRLAQEVRNLVYNQTLAAGAVELRDLEPDVLYERYALFGFGGIELARALMVPHLLEVNAPLVREHARARGIHLRDLAHALEKRVWSQTDALLVVSEELRAEALAAGVRSDHIHVLPNGVDAALFTPSPAARTRVRAELGLGPGPVIGFVGSLKPWHGTEILLRAFAQLHARHADAALLVVGDGPQRQALASAVESAGLQAAVRFTGAVDHKAVPEYMAAMDIATAPYLPQEDFYFSPIKVYEAMVLGLPVVASRIGQIAGLADAGLVVGAEAGNVDEWVEALGTLLDDAAGRAQVAARGRDWGRRERTWTMNARRVVALAEALLPS